jgi:hypothetical protein
MPKPYGRPPVIDRPKLDAQLIVPVTTEVRDQLVREARQVGYWSLAAYIRDFKLRISAQEVNPTT